MMGVWRAGLLGSFALLLFTPATSAATLRVGPDQKLAAPSDAAKIAKSGDTVLIEPQSGGYFDCALWEADNLTIEGIGNDVIITDRTCAGKGLFIINGRDVTIRNLTFQRARVNDQNGAGIRAQGANLRIDHVRFINNQVGMLAGDRPDSTIIIADSEFTANGKCDSACVPALYVDHVKLLRVENSTFTGTKGGDHILSAAARTELVGDDISDGNDGASRRLVTLPDGGSLVMRDNHLEKGPRSTDPDTAIQIMAPSGASSVSELTLVGNRFKNDTSGSVIFVKNWSSATPTMASNDLDRSTVPVTSNGYFWFEAKSLVRASETHAKMLAKQIIHLFY